MRPYDRIMYLLLVPVLKWAMQRDVPWNGMLDLLAEGLEHGMRWIKHRFAHCNQCGCVGGRGLGSTCLLCALRAASPPS